MAQNNTIDPVLLNRLTNALKMMLNNSPIQLTSDGKIWCEENDYNADGQLTIYAINDNESFHLININELTTINDIPQEFILL